MAEQVNTNTNKRTAATAAGKQEHKTGPFVAIVRNHLDSSYMGNLEVELLTQAGSGNSTNAPGQIVSVKYLSPFAGITSYDGTNKNAGAANSQRSYGFWGIPPDIGAKVLVIFAEGGDGFWIGCIPEENVNLMMPDPWVSSTFNDSNKSQKLPVVEYNKKTEKGTGRNPTQFIKPTNKDAVDILTAQGLITDEIRGVTSSSARREIPSMVTGFSSPGPADKRPGAPRVNYGENFAQTPVAQNRLGGSSLVFDDGDATLLRKGPASSSPPVYANAENGERGGDPTLPHNELVRLRTRTGHQILLHNTEDLIYIANARGTAWIELTSNGKIDIYASDSISLHTEADLNIKADKNVNIEAGADINLKAGNNTNVTAPGSVNLDTPDTNMKNLDVNGSAIISVNTNTGALSAGSINGTSAGSAWSDTDGSGSSDNQKLGSHTAASPTAPISAIPSARVPEHEPWAEHENLHASVANTPDTFRQSTRREVESRPATTADTPAAEGGAEAPNAAATGVTQTPTTATAAASIPSGVTDAVNSVRTAMSSVNVGTLTNAISDIGNKLTFGVSQAITKTIDTIASSSALKLIQDVTGPAIEDMRQAASSLLALRTITAKGQVPSPVTVPTPTTPAVNVSEADRQIVLDVARGRYTQGSKVTLTDGNEYTVGRTVTQGANNEEVVTWSLT